MRAYLGGCTSAKSSGYVWLESAQELWLGSLTLVDSVKKVLELLIVVTECMEFF